LDEITKVNLQKDIQNAEKSLKKPTTIEQKRIGYSR
jgi:hypothetical protein